jgi:circadian clock protein KaiC
MRGLDYLDGRHDYRIRTGGLVVHPRTSFDAEHSHLENGLAGSGNREIDKLLGGGLLFGSTCLISGTPGAGKSSLGTLYAHAAAQRRQRSAIFSFDERREIYLRRARAQGLDLEPCEREGLVKLHQSGMGEMSPGEFACRLRDEVNERGVKVLIIDSLTGYLNAMQGDQSLLIPQLHNLLKYVADAGTLTLLVGNTCRNQFAHASWFDSSFLADAILMARSFDSDGRLRRCLGVIKKRYGAHEQTIREMTIGQNGIVVGPPLHQFRGLLTDQPQFSGEPDTLLAGDSGVDGDRRA